MAEITHFIQFNQTRPLQTYYALVNLSMIYKKYGVLRADTPGGALKGMYQWRKYGLVVYREKKIHLQHGDFLIFRLPYGDFEILKSIL